MHWQLLHLAIGILFIFFFFVSNRTTCIEQRCIMFIQFSQGKNLVSTQWSFVWQQNASNRTLWICIGFSIFNFPPIGFAISHTYKPNEYYWWFGWFIAVFTETDDQSFITSAICPRSDNEIAFSFGVMIHGCVTQFSKHTFLNRKFPNIEHSKF